MAAKNQNQTRRLTPHWKSRIVGHARIDPKKIKVNANNWRVHPEGQQRAMRDVFDKIGVIQGVLINKRTGNLIDGHMRRQLAIDNDEELLDVTYVDLSVDEENLALSIINPMGELAATDPEKLGQLLGIVPRGEGSPLDAMLQQLEEMASGAMVKQTAETGGRGKGTGSGAHTQPVMRMMLENPDVATVERAIGMTGLQNRGAALLHICKSFMSKQHAEGQHDAEPEGSLENQFAQALVGGSSGTRNPRRPRKGVGEGLPASEKGRGDRGGPDQGGDPVPPATDMERVSGQG